MKNSFSFKDATFDVDVVRVIERYEYNNVYAIKVTISTNPLQHVFGRFETEDVRDAVYEALRKSVLGEKYGGE